MNIGVDLVCLSLAVYQDISSFLKYPVFMCVLKGVKRDTNFSCSLHVLYKDNTECQKVGERKCAVSIFGL